MQQVMMGETELRGDDKTESDVSEEDMSEMEVMIRTIKNEVFGLKVSLFSQLSLKIIIEKDVQRGYLKPNSVELVR
jgi:hypothetical protein